MQRLQQLLQAKRTRTHDTTANDHEECDKKSSDDMDLADHRREATRIQNRRSIPLGSRGEVPTPQEGKAGPLSILAWGLWDGLRTGVLATVRGVWGCVQARAQWSTEEDTHMRPDHHWLCEFGDAGNGTSCESQFNLDHRKCEDYRGTRFYNKDSALVIKRRLNRVEEDASGLTFQEWTPDVDTSRPPVAMLINSIEIACRWFQAQGSVSSST